MTTFVLVHGAMHGGWCWGEVRRSLTAHGHDVYTPTLTGQGDRRHELTRDTCVRNHVDDLCDLLWFEDITDVHLVLHSYAGVLAGPVAEGAVGRLSSIVYLAAFITTPGPSLLDVEPLDVAMRYRRAVAATGDGWYLPATDHFLDQWGISDERLRCWVAPRLTDFPFRCQTDVTSFDPHPLDQLRKVYINHTDPPLPSLQRFFNSARSAGWETHELAHGHDLMLAAPDETVALLESIVEPDGSTT